MKSIACLALFLAVHAPLSVEAATAGGGEEQSWLSRMLSRSPKNTSPKEASPTSAAAPQKSAWTVQAYFPRSSDGDVQAVIEGVGVLRAAEAAENQLRYDKECEEVKLWKGLQRVLQKKGDAASVGEKYSDSSDPQIKEILDKIQQIRLWKEIQYIRQKKKKISGSKDGEVSTLPQIKAFEENLQQVGGLRKAIQQLETLKMILTDEEIQQARARLEDVQELSVPEITANKVQTELSTAEIRILALPEQLNPLPHEANGQQKGEVRHTVKGIFLKFGANGDESADLTICYWTPLEPNTPGKGQPSFDFVHFHAQKRRQNKSYVLSLSSQEAIDLLKKGFLLNTQPTLTFPHPRQETNKRFCEALDLDSLFFLFAESPHQLGKMEYYQRRKAGKASPQQNGTSVSPAADIVSSNSAASVEVADGPPQEPEESSQRKAPPPDENAPSNRGSLNVYPQQLYKQVQGIYEQQVQEIYRQLEDVLAAQGQVYPAEGSPPLADRVKHFLSEALTKAVGDLRRELAETQSSLRDVRAVVSTHSEEKRALETQKDDLQKTITTLEEKISTQLQQHGAELQTKEAALKSSQEALARLQGGAFEEQLKSLQEHLLQELIEMVEEGKEEVPGVPQGEGGASLDLKIRLRSLLREKNKRHSAAIVALESEQKTHLQHINDAWQATKRELFDVRSALSAKDVMFADLQAKTARDIANLQAAALSSKQQQEAISQRTAAQIEENRRTIAHLRGEVAGLRKQQAEKDEEGRVRDAKHAEGIATINAKHNQEILASRERYQRLQQDVNQFKSLSEQQERDNAALREQLSAKNVALEEMEQRALTAELACGEKFAVPVGSFAAQAGQAAAAP